jgi:hypothetical protein
MPRTCSDNTAFSKPNTFARSTTSERYVHEWNVGPVTLDGTTHTDCLQ